MTLAFFIKYGRHPQNLLPLQGVPLLFLISLLFASFVLSGNVQAQKEFYSIHLGVYGDVDKAKASVDHLKKLGHNAFYREETNSEKGHVTKVYKVYIEQYKSKAEAEKEAGILKELGLISNYTVEAIGEKSKTDLPPTKQDIPFEESHPFRIASMREKANAEKMVERFQKSGYRVLYRKEAVKNKGLWYRVYMYGYGTKAEAEKDAKKLLNSGLISGYVFRQGEKRAKSDQKSVFLHVSSFKEKENARQTVQSLINKGLKAFMVEEEVSGSNWFRVYIGEFENEAEARKEGQELKEKGIIDYFKPFEIDKDQILGE
jgi:cell division septation protein DedD